MPHRHSPRRGSLAYVPRKRAARIYPAIRQWAHSNEAKPLGFAGFKAGMTHIQYIDGNNKSPRYNRVVSKAVTVIDSPSLFVCAVRFYRKTPQGFSSVGESWAKTVPKGLDLKRKTMQGKKDYTDMKDVADVRLVVATQPEHSGLAKKKPDVFEIAIGGKLEDRIKYAQEMLGKALDAKDVFKPGEFVDVSAVTKGSGYTGAVKRYGIRIQTRKDKQMHRHVGSIGSTVPRHIDWRVPMAGQYGYLTRTEFGKRIIEMSDDAKKVTPKGGFVGYGNVKSYLLVEGSVPGPSKRLIRLRKSVRSAKVAPVDVRYVSTESKQGR